jgi:hypothetical protein
LVIDVMVRQGRPVDSSEDTGGAGDRPPTSQIERANDAPVAAAKGSDSETHSAAILEKPPLEKPSHSSGKWIGGSNQSTHTSDRTAAARRSDTTQIVVLPGAATYRGEVTLAQISLDQALPRAIHKKSIPAISPEKWASWGAAGSAVAVMAAVSTGPKRWDRFLSRMTTRSLSKGARLTRKLKRANRDDGKFSICEKIPNFLATDERTAPPDWS